VKELLAALPCFNHVESITAITSGLSQHCFKINADNNVYFAKTTAGEIETKVALSAAKQGFSPEVIYYNQHWLVTRFIHADNLALASFNNTDKSNINKNSIEKNSIAVKLMWQCHQLEIKPAKLAPERLINELINKLQCSLQQKKELLSYAKSILNSLNLTNSLVCCHGDLNFSNILLDQKKHAWLVDYECACLAPAEYDLAMFIAVNNIAKERIAVIVKQYESSFHLLKVDSQQLNNYLSFSYFINSLWYKQAHQKQNNATLLGLYQQQWQKFISS